MLCVRGEGRTKKREKRGEKNNVAVFDTQRTKLPVVKVNKCLKRSAFSMFVVMAEQGRERNEERKLLLLLFIIVQRMNLLVLKVTNNSGIHSGVCPW